MGIPTELIDPSDEKVETAFYENYLSRSINVIDTIESIYNPESSSVVVLDGDWGSGKTFFLKMVERSIRLNASKERAKLEEVIQNLLYEDTAERGKELYAKSNIRKALTDIYPFYFDAWEHDDEQDPLVSLVYCLTEHFIYNQKTIFADGNSMLRTIITSCESIVKLSQGSLIDFDALKKVCEVIGKFRRINKSDENDSLISDDRYRTQKEQVNSYFKQALEGTGHSQLLIIIDELDRCNPTYAVKMLERIKHYFNCPGVSFLIGANLKQLSNTINNYYGKQFDSERYLKRFFDLHLKLSPIYTDKFNEYYEYQHKSDSNIVLGSLFDKYNLSLRDRLQLLRSYSMLNVRDVFDDLGCTELQFTRNVLIPVILVLSHISEDKRNKFLNGEDSEPLVSLADSHAAETISGILTSSKRSRNAIGLGEELERLYTHIFIPNYESNGVMVVGGNEFYKQNLKNSLSRYCFLIA